VYLVLKDTFVCAAERDYGQCKDLVFSLLRQIMMKGELVSLIDFIVESMTCCSLTHFKLPSF
jgi:hypothetical protein